MVGRRLLLTSSCWRASHSLFWSIVAFRGNAPCTMCGRGWRKYASTDLQRAFVSNVILGHFGFFAPLVFIVEVIISVALLLGFWSRFGSLLGAAMAINLSQGLYRSPGEWPWQYIFLIIIMVQFSLVPPGRSLGLDVLLDERDGSNQGAVFRLLRWVR